jgi:hypothetical protein
MRDNRQVKNILDLFHVSNIFNEFPVMLVPKISEENKDKKLMLGVRLLRIFTGVKR